MQRLQLEITAEAADFVVRQELFKRNHSRIKSMLDESKRIRASIPATFAQLIQPQLNGIDQIMLPGQTHLTWMSPGIEEFCDKCVRAISALDLTLKRCCKVFWLRDFE